MSFRYGCLDSESMISETMLLAGAKETLLRNETVGKGVARTDTSGDNSGCSREMHMVR